MSSTLSSENQIKHIPFHDKTIPEHDEPRLAIGGVLSCSQTAWTAHGAHLRVVDLRTGRRISSWCFGHTIRDPKTRVLCVIELPDQNTASKCPRLLAVGLNSGSICIYEVSTSRVLRAIHVGAPVTSLVAVGPNRAFNVPGRLIDEFDGVLGIGLEGGDVLLVDLCIQAICEAFNIYNSQIIYNEERPCEVLMLHRGDLGRLNRLKERSTYTERHLAYHLNYHPTMDETITNPNSTLGTAQESYFPLQGSSGDILLFTAKSDCSITTLFYAQRLCAVLIGYSFGCWQMWSLLDNMVLLYTSLWHKDRVPVAHFTLQDPSDDPRTCCYLWAIHSYREQEQHAHSAPHAVMYSLNYERKEWHDGYGYLYERLVSCTIRFQMDLICDTASYDVGGHCLAARSYSVSDIATGNTDNNNAHRHDATASNGDDALELCAISYTATQALPSDGAQQHCRTRTYLLLFDLNQWYLSQMPSEIRPNHSDMYMTRVCVSDYSASALLLDVRLDVATLRPFRQQLRRLEEHFRPESLSYSCMVLTSNGAIILHHMGIQVQLFHQLYTLGPLALLKPGQLFTQALNCGIINNTHPTIATSTTSQQRETLLDIALEHSHLHTILERCATEWADGSSLAVGCALHWLLEWAWQKATQLKSDVDVLCVSLFDGTTSKLSALDGHAMIELDAYSGQLGRLKRLFEHVRGMVDDRERKNEQWMVQRRCETLGAVCRWLRVVRWLLANGLLPESLDNAPVTYPADRIKDIVNQRRFELHKAQQNVGNNLPSPQLYIDSLIEEELAGNIRIKYPPPSLQTALRTYLIQAEQSAQTNEQLTQHQHAFFFYLMLDIVDQNQQQYKFTGEQLVTCPALSNDLPRHQSKLIEAMWQLDRGHFAQAMEQLIDPSVTRYTSLWQHRCIVMQLLSQDQHRFALLYVQLRRSPGFGGVRGSGDFTGADWLMCTLFVRNGRLYDALKCRRNGRRRRGMIDCDDLAKEGSEMDPKESDGDSSDERLLSHIWSECDRIGQLNNTLITTIHGLDKVEENSLFCYMDRAQYPNRHILRGIYNMQRTAHQHNFDNSINDIDTSTEQQSSTVYAKIMKYLMGGMSGIGSKINSKIDGAAPMSVLVHHNDFSAVAKANKETLGNYKIDQSSSMLWAVRDACAATVSSILCNQEQQQRQQNRHLRGQKRKLELLVTTDQHQTSHELTDAIDDQRYNCFDSATSQKQLRAQSNSNSKLFHRKKLLRDDIEQQFSSPLKKMKHTSTTSYEYSATATDYYKNIDTSFQMATPLIMRQGQQHMRTSQDTPPPSGSQQQHGAIMMETPQSILKKRIQTTNRRELSEGTERRESATPNQLDSNIQTADTVVHQDLREHQNHSPKRRPPIGVGASVRFDVSLTSSSPSRTDDCSQHQQQADLSAVNSNSKRSSDATSTSTAIFYSPDNSSSLTSSNLPSATVQLETEENKSILTDKDVIQNQPNDLEMGKSPLRRKPIGDITEGSIGVRSSPRLQQRRSVDRELSKNLTQTFAPSSPRHTLSARKSTFRSHQQNNSTIETIQSELTPLKMGLFERRCDSLEQQDRKRTIKISTNQIEAMEGTGLAEVGIIDESTGKNEAVQQMEPVTVVNVLREEIEENVPNKIAEQQMDKSRNFETFTSAERDVQTTDDDNMLIVEVASNLEESKATNASDKDDDDDESDEYLDDAGQVTTCIIGDNLLELNIEAEPMDIDPDNVIEISSNSDSSSDNTYSNSESSIEELERNNPHECNIYSASEESSKTANVSDHGSTTSLNRARFIEDDSKECSQESSAPQQNSDVGEEDESYSVTSANVGFLEDEINVDTTKVELHERNNDDYVYEISAADDNSNDNSIRYSDRESNEDESHFCSTKESSLNLNIREEQIDSDNNTEFKDNEQNIQGIAKEIKSIVEKDKIEQSVLILRKPNVSSDTTINRNELKIDLSTIEREAKVLSPTSPIQISLIHDYISASHVIEEDILCMSFPESDEKPKEDNNISNLPADIYSKQNDSELAVDPLIEESVIVEGIQVDPGILTVTFTEDQLNSMEDQNDVTICRVEPKAAPSEEENKAILVTTRRSARLRKDSTSSIDSSTSVMSSSSNAIATSKKSLNTNTPKRRTRRSMSANEAAENSANIPSADTVLPSASVIRPTQRSNRRAQSVDTSAEAWTDPEGTLLQQRQTAQWLSTITEEHHVGQELDEPTLEQQSGQIKARRLLGVARVGMLTQTVRVEGGRQRRATSVDSVTVVQKPKRGRPRKTAEGNETIDCALAEDLNNSPIKPRTRARTNSSSTTLSDSAISTSSRSTTLARIDHRMGEGGGECSPQSPHTPPKRSRRGNRASGTSKL